MQLEPREHHPRRVPDEPEVVTTVLHTVANVPIRYDQDVDHPRVLGTYCHRCHLNVEAATHRAWHDRRDSSGDAATGRRTA
jgi:hypothetical protein